jgi:RNA polymerase sigma factor (sigma-70 family)
MSSAAPSRSLDWSDERLIAACLERDSEAWSVLIDRYKNLIYSIPVRMGLHQEANDIFQSVCLDLLAEMGKLREPKALPKWLMQTCYHKCLAAQRRGDRQAGFDQENRPEQADTAPMPEAILLELQREQAVRDAVQGLSERCRQMVYMLFYEDPPRSYDSVAGELNLATGSIGFIRGRCLKQLRKELSRLGPQ